MNEWSRNEETSQRSIVWKKFEICKKFLSVLIVVLFFFLQGCESVKNDPFQLNQIIETKGFSLPYISIENNQLCLRDALLHETLALQSLPTKNAAVTKPIFRQNALYFSIWDQDEGSSWSSVWKYQMVTGEISIIWENKKEKF